MQFKMLTCKLIIGYGRMAVKGAVARSFLPGCLGLGPPSTATSNLADLKNLRGKNRPGATRMSLLAVQHAVNAALYTSSEVDRLSKSLACATPLRSFEFEAS